MDAEPKIGMYALALHPVTDMDLRPVRAVSVEEIRVCVSKEGPRFIQKAHGLRGVIAKYEQLMLINAWKNQDSEDAPLDS